MQSTSPIFRLNSSIVCTLSVPGPGETHTYTWYITTGPTEQQEECAVMAYYSTADVVKVIANAKCEERDELQRWTIPPYFYGAVER